MGSMGSSMIVTLVAVLLMGLGCADPPTFGIYLTEHDSFTTVRKDESGVVYSDVAIDAGTVRLADRPLISGDDILSYDWASHTVTVKPGVGQTLPQPDSFGVPFVVVADGQRCYMGGLWSRFSSVGTHLPIIDRMDAEDDTFRIQLGHPGPRGGPDPRNVPRIKAVFRKLGKLEVAG